jgi:cytochrome c oxidase subunit 2
MNDWLRRLLYLPPEGSTYAAGIDHLHFAVIGTTLLGATFVFLLAVYFLLRHPRRAEGELTEPRRTPWPVELFVIAGLQTLFLAFWVVGAVQYDHVMTPPHDGVRVYVTAKQWMWKFGYPGGRSSIDVLTVPAGRDVVLVMTSRDVIHSFYVPAFRLKQDVVPGRYQTAWFRSDAPGTYDLECAEFCGTSHSAMLGKVRVLAAGDYARWLEDTVALPGADSPGADGDLAAAGRDVAVRRGCFQCHSVDGQPSVGPSWARLYRSRVALTGGRSVVADEAYLTRSMMEPQADVVEGYRPVMPTYRGVLEQPEVAALVEFIEALGSAPFSPSVTLPRVVPEDEGRPQEPKP